MAFSSHGKCLPVSDTHFTRARLITALQALGDEFTTRGVRGQIFVVGGAAMALSYSTRRVTRDIDAVFEPKPTRRCAGTAGRVNPGAGAVSWHGYGMERVRVSTTVDSTLLSRARGTRPGITDGSLIDEALTALLARNATSEIDPAYAAYDQRPLSEADEWGDLATFRAAAGSS
jgi:hypothetical protein